MLSRTTVYIDYEELKKLKKILIEKDEDFSKLLRKWISKYIDMNNTVLVPSVKSPSEVTTVFVHPIEKLRKLEEQVKSQVNNLALSSSQEFSICPTCYIPKSKPTTLVTYIDSEQIKVANKLCNDCIAKAKALGNFKWMGDKE